MMKYVTISLFIRCSRRFDDCHHCQSNKLYERKKNCCRQVMDIFLRIKATSLTHKNYFNCILVFVLFLDSFFFVWYLFIELSIFALNNIDSSNECGKNNKCKTFHIVWTRSYDLVYCIAMFFLCIV